MTLDELKIKVSYLAETAVKVQGLEIIEIRTGLHKRVFSIQIFADRPAGGITLEECSSLHLKVDGQIFETLLPDGQYTLEVSSPGLDRCLTTARDMARVVGREIHVFLSVPVLGKHELRGRLVSTGEKDFIVLVGKQEVVVSFENLKNAKQIIT